ncbi:SDR family oxidoreductase [Sphaerimonospora mesophila]|uniref:SDR family oxidoreductase n=1 Tax=Sphaerimonospora mesophila TaxID=37483 RepID=UPI0006E36F7D
MEKYSDKNVVVTGGSSGIGLEIARFLADDTGILERSMTKEEAEQFKAERLADNPMRRFGTLDEIATAAAFLAFDATYTAGIELAVDGGVTQL